MRTLHPAPSVTPLLNRMTTVRSLLITLCSLLLLGTPASATIDSLAFGDSPEVMVYLFCLQEVGQSPDSPDTLKRLNKGIAFCKGKLGDDLVTQLQNFANLIKVKKYAQARKAAKELRDEIYGE